MKIIVFSDVHGNPFACEAVLRAIEKEKPYDDVICAGDLCLGGSNPGECVRMIRSAGISAVYGNTEGYILEPDQEPEDELHSSMWYRIQPVSMWVRSQLDGDQLDWLGGLPFEKRFSPTTEHTDDLLVVHANPRDVELMILPPESDQLRLWGEIRQADDDPQLIEVLQEGSAGTIVFGHYHFTHQRRWRDLSLVDVAPCSMPGVDRDPQARYSIFSWDGNRWHVTRRWAPYNVELEVRALQNSDMPYKEDFIRYFI